MHTLSVIASLILAVAALGSGGATLARVPAVMASVTGVGFPEDKAWILGLLKILGGLGLIIGLFVGWLAILAAIGLVLYFIGALVFHARAQQRDIAPAVGLLVLSVLTLVLLAAA